MKSNKNKTKKQDAREGDFLKLRELMALLRVSKATVIAFINSGMPYIGVSDSSYTWRFSKHAIYKWMGNRNNAKVYQSGNGIIKE